MAATRERRGNAGNRMAKLLNEEEEDEFYKTTYGGFEEEEGDEEYHSEEEESDEVDTDFSIDENDEVVSDQDEDEPKRKRKKPFVAKVATDQKKPKSKESSSTKEKLTKIDKTFLTPTTERKSIRSSTKEKSRETELRQKEREESQRRKEKRTFLEYHQFTQEELLVEAKITEQKNIKSLESYQRLELERKKNRIVKKSYKGPLIRYQSVSMPLIEELPSESEKIDVVEDKEMVEAVVENKTDSVTKERCSRNFITFTDENTFREIFQHSKPTVPQKNVCPITRLPARYYDSVTQMPYANLQAFKVLREAYYQQLEQKGDPKQPDVAAWIEWRKKTKSQPSTVNRLPSAIHQQTPVKT
ncbi:Vacuolar protein sorting-associated protein 72, variant 2 [Chamberlinius hualienensis]